MELIAKWNRSITDGCMTVGSAVNNINKNQSEEREIEVQRTAATHKTIAFEKAVS